MAGPLDTGQEIATHLLLHIIPIVLYHLTFLVLPEDPMSFRFLATTIAQTLSWWLRGHPRGARPKRIKCFKKPKKKLVSKEIQDKTIKQKLHTYLIPALFAAFRVGCCVKSTLRRRFLRPLQQALRFLALQGASLDNPVVRFTQTCSPLGLTTMHHDAWPTPCITAQGETITSVIVKRVKQVWVVNLLWRYPEI